MTSTSSLASVLFLLSVMRTIPPLLVFRWSQEMEESIYDGWCWRADFAFSVALTFPRQGLFFFLFDPSPSDGA